MLWFLYWVSFKTAKRIPMILFHLCRLLIIVMSLDHKFVKVIIGSFYYEYLWYPKFVKLINEVLMRSHMVNIWFVHLNNKSQIISFKHKYALLLCIIWIWKDTFKCPAMNKNLINHENLYNMISGTYKTTSYRKCLERIWDIIN